MTSSDLLPVAPSDRTDPEAADEKVFTRPRLREANLKILQSLAFELIHPKTEKVSSLEREIEALNGLLEMIAIVIGKTYAERGDSFALADDEALTLIRDLLLQHDPSLIVRNKNKRVPKDVGI
jgi:hypothetical protein